MNSSVFTDLSMDRSMNLSIFTDLSMDRSMNRSPFLDLSMDRSMNPSIFMVLPIGSRMMRLRFAGSYAMALPLQAARRRGHTGFFRLPSSGSGESGHATPGTAPDHSPEHPVCENIRIFARFKRGTCQEKINTGDCL
jgi:hypothetical protein